jgi:hypothetical protein
MGTSNCHRYRSSKITRIPRKTGKTTVVVKISYEAELRGERALIGSQANLAVDNALSRLIHKIFSSEDLLTIWM